MDAPLISYSGGKHPRILCPQELSEARTLAGYARPYATSNTATGYAQYALDPPVQGATPRWILSPPASAGYPNQAATSISTMGSAPPNHPAESTAAGAPPRQSSASVSGGKRLMFKDSSPYSDFHNHGDSAVRPALGAGIARSSSIVLKDSTSTPQSGYQTKQQSVQSVTSMASAPATTGQTGGTPSVQSGNERVKALLKADFTEAGHTVDTKGHKQKVYK